MSHTGTVTRPNSSPGMIRVITTGYVVSKNNELVFRKPKTHDSPVDSAKERFILFLPSESRKYQYGDAVKFNLEYYKNWESTLKRDFGQRIDEFESKVNELKNINGFQFKYVSTDIECVPSKFILNPFFNMICDLDEQSIENYIDKIKGITQYHLKYNLKVNCKDGNHSIRMVKVIDADEFDWEYGDPEKELNIVGTMLSLIRKRLNSFYVKDCSDVDSEIDRKGQHSISSDEHIPTKEDRILCAP